MKIRVQYFANTRELANLREETLELENGTDVLHLLKILVIRHGKLRDYIFDSETGNPRSSLQFMVNDNMISNLNGYATILTEDCTFAIIPPVGGG
ncbi:MAG: MoaD/ThiS family protein [Candidatus Bathyarchaeia archaeon]